MRTLFIAIFSLVLSTSLALAKPVTVNTVTGTVPLLPYLTWLADPEGQQTVESIAANTFGQRFSPLDRGFPLKATGPVWLRLLLVKSPPGSGVQPVSDGIVMKVGALPAGETVMFSPATGPIAAPGAQLRGTVRSHENIALPDPGLTPASILIRMDETPGPWFAPTLVPKSSVRPDLLPPDQLLPGLLFLSLVACLLRAMKERALWPAWAALFLGCALVQTLASLPRLNLPFSFGDLPPLLAPGLALIILPHIGRVLLGTRKVVPVQDALLCLYSLLGVALCLIPLVPEYAWAARLFPIWPLLLIPLLPLCLAAAGRRSGSLPFTGACLMPAAGAIIAFFSMNTPQIHPLAPTAALWGLAVGGIGLALARTPKAETKSKLDMDIGHVLLDAPPLQNPADADASSIHTELSMPSLSLPAAPSGKPHPLDLPDTSIFAHQAPMDSTPFVNPTTFVESIPFTLSEEPPVNLLPRLRVEKILAPATQLAETAMNATVTAATAASPAAAPTVAVVAATAPTMAPVAASPAIPPKEVAATTTSPVAPKQSSAPQAMPTVTAAASNSAATAALSSEPRIISLEKNDFSSYFGQPADYLKKQPAADAAHETTVFNLQALASEVHAIISPPAQQKGLFFSWFIAPALPPLLEGDSATLRKALTLLLQNAVQATLQGAVRLSVHAAPGVPTKPGQCSLLFTVSDSGAAERTDAGFFHAWELAVRTGGAFIVDYSASGGTQVSFSSIFTQPSDGAITAYYESLPARAYSDGGSAQNALFLPPGTSRPAPRAQAPADDEAEPNPLVMVVDMTTSNRRLLSNYLNGITGEHIVAPSASEATRLFQQFPTPLIVFDADMPESEIISSVATMQEHAARRALPPVSILALTSHEAQSSRMLNAGCTHVLCKPFAREDLEAIVFQALGDKVASLQSEADASSTTAGADAAPAVSSSPFAGSTPYAAVPEWVVATNDTLAKPNISAAPAAPVAPAVRATPVALTPQTTPAVTATHTTVPVAHTTQAATTQPTIHVIQSAVRRNTNVTSTPPAAPKAPAPPRNLSITVHTPLKNAAAPRAAIAAAIASTQGTPSQTVAPMVRGLSADDVTPPNRPPSLASTPPNNVAPVAIQLTPASPQPAPVAIQFTPSPTLSMPLPHIQDEYIDIVMLPLLPNLVHTLRDALVDATQGRDRQRTIIVQEAVGRIAGKAEEFGLHKLSKISRCVERAAAADDLDAVTTLMKDLESVTQRYLAALNDCYTTFLQQDRQETRR